MKQFDILANPFPRRRERQPYLVALQSDLLSNTLDTVVVAPLEMAASEQIRRPPQPGRHRG